MTVAESIAWRAAPSVEEDVAAQPANDEEALTQGFLEDNLALLGLVSPTLDLVHAAAPAGAIEYLAD